MSRTIIMPPTTSAALSVALSLPPLVWSPDPALCSTRRVNEQGEPVTANYDGSALAHRQFRVMLFAGYDHELPADARLRAYVKIADAGFYDNEQRYAQYEPLPQYDLTPERKALFIHGPIDGLEWRKCDSETPYGAIAFGAFGDTANASA